MLKRISELMVFILKYCQVTQSGDIVVNSKNGTKMNKKKSIECRYMYNIKRPFITQNNWFLFKYMIIIT